ncbi:MAG: YmfQ family protein [Candidatus Methylumidiphilus sp.]
MELRTAADYFRALQSLLPTGPAWPRTDDSNLSRLLSAIAEEFARLEARAVRLLDEASPAKTIELLTDWESWLGLPSTCMALEPQSFEQRQAAVVSKLTDVGGQRAEDFIALAARLGAVVTITVFDLATDLDDDMQPDRDYRWRFVMRVNMPAAADSVRMASEMSTDADAEALWGNRLLECVIRSRAKAEIIVLFSYPE